MSDIAIQNKLLEYSYRSNSCFSIHAQCQQERGIRFVYAIRNWETIHGATS